MPPLFLRVFFPASVALFFALPGILTAETACTFDPFTTRLSQGESGALSVTVNLPTASTSYALTLGNLPDRVHGGFLELGSSTLSDLVKNVALNIQADPGAQTGSFMVPILCRIAFPTGVSESVNQFNLVISKATTTQVVNPSVAVPSVTPPALEDSTPTLLPLVVSGTLPEATTTESVAGEFLVSIGRTLATTSALIGSSTSPRGYIIASLRRGTRGGQVSLLQELLKFLGFFPEDVEPTGYFGPITEASVRKFQAEHGIESIGVVGPKTRGALKETVSPGENTEEE